MQIRDRRLKVKVHVADKECPKRHCYWPRVDPGYFTQGQGYSYRSDDWLCGTREISGCPDVETGKDSKDASQAIRIEKR